MSPVDAEEMNLTQDDRIKVTSEAGEIERQIIISRNIQAGYLYVPTAYNQNDARYLVQLKPLLDASSSGWDSCHVTVEKV